MAPLQGRLTHKQSIKRVTVWSGLPFLFYSGPKTQDCGMGELRQGQPEEVMVQMVAKLAATWRVQVTVFDRLLNTNYSQAAQFGSWPTPPLSQLRPLTGLE